MGRVLYGAACSLDGYIARADGSVDWLHFSQDVSNIIKETFARYDTFLWGRHTYEVAAAAGHGPGTGKARNLVFSRTLTGVSKGFDLVRGDAREFVTSFRNGEAGEACVMGGGVLAASLLEAGLVDEVGLNVHPVLLGRGIPMFPPMATQVDLELTESRPIDGGCIYSTYRTRAR